MEELRKCPGGYKRADVTAYVEKLVQKYEQQLADATAETAEQKRQNDALLQENADLFKRISALENDRDMISKAVISAEQRAAAVLAEAQTRADSLLREKAAEAARVEDDIAELQEQLRTMRLAAIATIRKYESGLGGILTEQE